MIIMTNPWSQLRSGETQRAIRNMRDSYVQRPTASHIMELGVALLWIRHYDEAAEHFHAAVNAYPQKLASFYGMSGAAKWCSGDKSAAVAEWAAGLESQFADPAGGVRLPLLLFLASVQDNALFSRHKVEEILRRRAKMPVARKWPGPLAQFVLHEIDESSLRTYCAGFGDLDTVLRHWIADFYVGVLDLAENAKADFALSCKNIVRAAVEKSADDNAFLGFIWNEEFFIARNEAFGKTR